MSILLPFTQTVPQTTTREATALPRTFSLRKSKQSVAEIDLPPTTPPDLALPERKRSWGIKRRPSWRRVSTLHARDWSCELEESEYNLPFELGAEEMERGSRTTRSRIVKFRDDTPIMTHKDEYLPALDTNLCAQGLGTDSRSPGFENRMKHVAGGLPGILENAGAEMGSIVETDSSLTKGNGIESMVTDVSATESEWTTL